MLTNKSLDASDLIVVLIYFLLILMVGIYVSTNIDLVLKLIGCSSGISGWSLVLVTSATQY